MYFKYIFKKNVLISLLALTFASALLLFGQACQRQGYLSSDGLDAASAGVCSSVNQASPQSIEDVTKLINSLPKPLSLECFLASLKRPLNVYAVNSVFSGQPAAGSRSPRIFILNDKLILSVVPAGLGKDLLEMSGLVDETTSIKAELKFPIWGPQGADAPYLPVRFNSGTTCAACHRGEHKAVQIDFAEAFQSEILRPSPSQEVALENIDEERRNCDPEKEWFRCSILRGVFGYGPVQRQDFSE